MKVSVIMPYFNKKEFVEASIHSVLSQTFENFEIIIIYDDTSQDDFKFIKDFEKLDNRIKVLKNINNIGAGRSRNKGIEFSEGEYVAFLDCDDIWYKNKLKEQLEFMICNDYEISFTSYDIIENKGNKIGSRKATKVLFYKDLIKSCDVGLSTVIIKKKILDSKDYKFADLKTKEDYVLWLKLSKANFNFYGLDKILTKWKKIDKSLSSNTFQKILDGFKVYNDYMGFNKIKSLYHLMLLSINFLKKK
ncbi:glycosyltransferase [Candidatus Pelagibacter ubique]|jgi:teichuronic acid biosynthesis glycosyltransferase TuaG|nr:glycosyltransferase [Candidatus Pelagibacter ubique]